MSVLTNPPYIESTQGIVNNIIVLPAKAPIPTDTCSLTKLAGPKPENNTIAPSGTAPNTGNTTLPIKPAYLVSKSNSEPSDNNFEAFKMIYA